SSNDMLRQAQHDPSTEALREARNENLPDNENRHPELVEGQTVFPLELNTMPGWAGSSWYFLRYMDAQNPEEFASKEAMDYWQNVDLYMGGSEHATGHLLYARFWQKFMFDRGWVPTDEFAQKLINQGMILGMSAFAHRLTLWFVQNENGERSDCFESLNIFVSV